MNRRVDFNEIGKDVTLIDNLLLLQSGKILLGFVNLIFQK